MTGPLSTSCSSGLRRLEYRGYDSAGVAARRGRRPSSPRSARASWSTSRRRWRPNPLPAATVGIGHTRWATHGAPTDRNAHPHLDDSGRVAVIHNGIIENFAELRAELEGRGREFRSDTDTEVAAHLLAEEYDRSG